MRYKEESKKIESMFFIVVSDLKYFIIMFYGFIATFTMIQFILSGKAKGEDYPGIHPFIRMFIQIFR